MPRAFQYPAGLGEKRNKNIKPRKVKSDTLPDPDNIPNTDPVVSNVQSLLNVNIKPIFSEMYARGRGDYAAFAHDFLDVTLHPGQVKWLHTNSWTNERCLSSGNRFGKSYAASVKIMHDAFYQTRPPQYRELTNEYVALNLSLTIDMAKIVTDYVLNFGLSSKLFRRFILENEVKTAPFPLVPIGTPKTQRNNAFRSEIWARSSAKDARYLLGRKFDFVNYDECARDPHGDKILDEVLRMRLADRGGRLDMTSTAAGRNWFFTAYQRGVDNSKIDPDHLQYWSMTGSSYDNPNIDHDRLAQNEAVMAEVWKLQNIFGGFSDYANVFFRPQVEDMYDGIEYPICTDYTKLDQIQVPPDAQYIIGMDWALKRDDSVIIVARIDAHASEEFTDKRMSVSTKNALPIVFMQGFNVKLDGSRWGWDELKSILALIHKRFNNAKILFDSTGLAGEILYQDLSGLGIVNHEGYDFSGNGGQSKDNLIMVAQQALQNKTFKFPYTPVTAVLVDQLLLYDRDDKNLKTDYVFGFCLLCECLRRAGLPAFEFLSLPLLFASGTRHLGRGLHPFDNAYELNSTGVLAKPHPLKDSFVLRSDGKAA